MVPTDKAITEPSLYVSVMVKTESLQLNMEILENKTERCIIRFEHCKDALNNEHLEFTT